MGAAAKITEIYTEGTESAESNPLIERARKYIKDNKMKIGELAREINYSRSTLNTFLTGTNKSNAIAERLEAYLDEKDAEASDSEKAADTVACEKADDKAREARGTLQNNSAEQANTTASAAAETYCTEDADSVPEASNAFSKPIRGRGGINPPKKPELFVTGDTKRIMGVCQSCQDYNEMGIITGRSGFGKTYALKEYAKLPRVVYIECDVTMGTRDLLKEIKRVLGIPHRSYGTNHDHITSIVDFLSVNKGYLIIVDEADKLMSKNTQSKMHVLRAIYDKTAGDSDRASCGIVIAGEPKLEAQIKMYLEQYAKRTIFGAELKGLTPAEVKGYLSGLEIEAEASEELITRATNSRTGCFRLLDRTMRNVNRILNESGGSAVTLKVLEEASGYMLL